MKTDSTLLKVERADYEEAIARLHRQPQPSLTLPPSRDGLAPALQAGELGRSAARLLAAAVPKHDRARVLKQWCKEFAVLVPSVREALSIYSATHIRTGADIMEILGAGLQEVLVGLGVVDPHVLFPPQQGAPSEEALTRMIMAILNQYAERRAAEPDRAATAALVAGRAERSHVTFSA